MCPAIMRIVRRGAPGTVAAQRPRGKCSKRKRVMRLLVLQAARIASRRSGGEGIRHLSTMTALMRRLGGSQIWLVEHWTHKQVVQARLPTAHAQEGRHLGPMADLMR